jgi:hypothetical protein
LGDLGVTENVLHYEPGEAVSRPGSIARTSNEEGTPSENYPAGSDQRENEVVSAPQHQETRRSSSTESFISWSTTKSYYVRLKERYHLAEIFIIVGFVVSILGVATGFIQIRQPNQNNNSHFCSLNSSQLLEMQEILKANQASLLKNQSGNIEQLIESGKHGVEAEREALQKEWARISTDRDRIIEAYSAILEEIQTCRSEIVSVGINVPFIAASNQDLYRTI